MNQIICTSNSHLEAISDPPSHRKRFFKLQFFAIISITVFSLSYYGYFRYDLMQKEKFSKDIMENLKMNRLYQDTGSYNATPLSSKVYFYENHSFSVIGSIQIEKLAIDYPILAEIDQELLKVSPCRFYGPMPNEVRKSLYCRA